MSQPNPFIPSLEAIEHQDQAFFKELAAAFRPMCLNKLKVSDIELHSDSLAKIQRLLKARMNIQVNLKIEPTSIPNAWVFPPMLSKNHSMYQDWLKDWLTNEDGLKALKAANDKKALATLDRKKVWVTGFFASTAHEVRVTLGILNMCSGEEVAAIFLHEIGHLWSYFEFLTLTAKTNAALRTVRKEFLQCEDAEQKVALVSSANSTYGFSDAEISKLRKELSVENVEVAVLNSIVRESYSELGFSLYDQRAWEFSSDQFSTRMGGGAYVVAGLDKMHREFSDPSYQSLYAHTVSMGIKTALFISLSVASVGLFPLLVFLMGDPFCEGETYDRPGERFTRVRHEMIAALRNPSVSKEMSQRMIEDIRTIDSTLKDIVDRHGLRYYLWAAISPGARRRRNQVKVEQALERLANNDLYIAAADLKHR